MDESDAAYPPPLARFFRVLQTLCHDEVTVLPVIDASALGEGGTAVVAE